MAKDKKKENLTLEERLQAALVPDWEQPYKVPENWCWTYLGIVSDIVTGGTPSKKNPEYYGGTFPFFKPADLDTGRHVIQASEYLSDEGKSVSRIIPEQSTAVCCIGSIGKSGFLEVSGTTNQQINSAIPKFNPLYLYYFCNTNFFVDELWKKASATTISIVNKSKMETCIFPLPPLLEQQRIVDRIESLFAKLDEAKQKAQDALDSFETRKAAILHKAFTGELTARWRKEHGVGMESWEDIELGKIIKVSSGKMLTAKNMNRNGNVPVYGGNGVTGVHDVSNVPANTIVIGRVGFYCGSVHYIKEPAWVTDNALIVSFNCEQFDTKFLFYLLSNTNLRKNESSTAQPVISGNKIYPIIVQRSKDLNEQTEIVRILDDLLAKEQEAKEVSESVLEQIDLMKKSILARAFRGELGTNDPAEESAVELMKEII